MTGSSYGVLCRKSVLASGRLDDARAVYIKIKTIFRKVPALLKTLQRFRFPW